ncbi:ArsR/SmtB family transcription factor [Shewanella algae]|uniref:ArsR/SmtB family transcription factor n=1 Tax=Shewanella algae TaxID=38313 RepID=UPI001AB016E8|nr:metalloregulator ArsR/SmtB family transcription factor [Shewanella algae]EKT4486405.1 metalloregulator ArsR/SmtB family transcription factor [Shewanella algae]MBO2549775.1 metalloregulator ArsR/SmtB family transcription factor [Shewanella algae]
MELTIFFKALADETRLRSLLLILQQGELCVCELTEALALSQPKISRHLAQLRTQGLLQDRRRGQWVFYRLSPELAPWCEQLLRDTLTVNPGFIADELTRLEAMASRPQACC